MDTPNPLAVARAIEREIEDLGPDLQPTGKQVRTHGMGDDWMKERRDFDSYLESRGKSGTADTAGHRMQAKQCGRQRRRSDTSTAMY